MRAVADTSSLIHPAKVPTFWTLMKATFRAILIPEAVYEEVLKGRGLGSPDVPVIQAALREGWIRRRNVRSQRRLPENLGRGEREAIALAQQEKVDWLLMDDKVASTTAKLMGLRVRSVAYLLAYWTRRRTTTGLQALEMLDDLVKGGYRLSMDDYVMIKDLIVTAQSQTLGNEKV